MEINKKLLKDIQSYCKLNDLNEDDFLNGILKKAFLIEKYGDKPTIFNKQATIEKAVASYEFQIPENPIAVDDGIDIIDDIIPTETKPKRTTKKRKLT